MIVIAPKFLSANWREEFAKWDISHEDVTFLSHHEVRKGKLPLKVNTILVIDESHFGFGNTKSKVFKALESWMKKMPPVYTLLLTGTPIRSKPSDIYGQLRVLGYNDCPKVWHFQERYCLLEPAFRGSSVMREKGILDVAGFEKLLNKWAMRVKLKEVTDLPKLNFVSQDLDLKEDRTLKELAYVLTPDDLRRALSENSRGIETKRVVAMAKAQAVVKDGILELVGERPTLVFSDHPDSLAKLVKGCPKDVTHGVINAKTPADERVKVAKAFQDGKIDRIYINIRCGGVGLNCQRAEYVFFSDLSYTPADNEQALARAYRKGRTEPLIVYEIYAGGHDKHLATLVSTKKEFMV